MFTRPATITLLGLGLFVAVALALDHSQWSREIRQDLASHVVPAEKLRGQVGTILARLGRVKSVPANPAAFADVEPAQYRLKSAYLRTSWKDQRHSYTADPQASATPLPSTTAVSQADLEQRIPLLSVVVPEGDLYDEHKGIVANHDQRGREWERFAYVSYFDNGKLQFGTAAGLRLHGGRDREGCAAHAHCSFRLYLRTEYGLGEVRLFGPDSAPIKRLVVRRHWGEPDYSNYLAFDVAREIGGVVQQLQPVRFYLNGKRYKGEYYLTEHQHKKQWALRLGHKNFLFYRYKSDNDIHTSQSYRRLRAWARHSAGNMTLEEASRRVDVDNLSRYIFSVVYLGTTDWHQGAAILDQDQAHPRWYWAHWDLDHSFGDFQFKHKQEHGKKIEREIWEQEAFELTAPKRYRARSMLFDRLRNESPQYRKYFTRLVMNQLNHVIDDEFMRSRIAHYESLFGTHNDDIGLFIENRPRFIRAQMKEYFDVGDAFSVEVNGPAGIEYQIDGHAETAGYSGWYFADEPISVEIRGPHKRHFSHWRVSGQTIAGSELRIPVDKGLVIEPVFM